MTTTCRDRFFARHATANLVSNTAIQMHRMPNGTKCALTAKAPAMSGLFPEPITESDLIEQEAGDFWPALLAFVLAHQNIKLASGIAPVSA